MVDLSKKRCPIYLKDINPINRQGFLALKPNCKKLNTLNDNDENQTKSSRSVVNVY